MGEGNLDAALEGLAKVWLAVGAADVAATVEEEDGVTDVVAEDPAVVAVEHLEAAFAWGKSVSSFDDFAARKRRSILWLGVIMSF